MTTTVVNTVANNKKETATEQAKERGFLGVMFAGYSTLQRNLSKILSLDEWQEQLVTAHVLIMVPDFS